jgi:hypothetical protein
MTTQEVRGKRTIFIAGQRAHGPSSTPVPRTEQRKAVSAEEDDHVKLEIANPIQPWICLGAAVDSYRRLCGPALAEKRHRLHGHFSPDQQRPGKANDTASEIVRDMETQAGTTREIAANISHASSGVRDVNNSVNQSSTTAGEISREI